MCFKLVAFSCLLSRVIRTSPVAPGDVVAYCGPPLLGGLLGRRRPVLLLLLLPGKFLQLLVALLVLLAGAVMVLVMAVAPL